MSLIAPPRLCPAGGRELPPEVQTGLPRATSRAVLSKILVWPAPAATTDRPSRGTGAQKTAIPETARGCTHLPAPTKEAIRLWRWVPTCECREHLFDVAVSLVGSVRTRSGRHVRSFSQDYPRRAAGTQLSAPPVSEHPDATVLSYYTDADLRIYEENTRGKASNRDAVREQDRRYNSVRHPV
jgi:hypothetical protein